MVDGERPALTHGRALVFVRRDGARIGPLHFGHVGWAFLREEVDGRALWACGSMENYSGALFSDNDDAGYWHVDRTPRPLDYFRAHRYNAYKAIEVEAPDPETASRLAQNGSDGPYILFRANCEDVVHHILKHYGVEGLPHPIDPRNWTPNAWFDAIDAPEFDTADESGVIGRERDGTAITRMVRAIRGAIGLDRTGNTPAGC